MYNQPLIHELARILHNKDAQPELAKTEEWVKDILRDEIFDRDEGLQIRERQARAYHWLDYLRGKINEHMEINYHEVVEDPRKLVTITGMLGLVDGAMWAAADLHYLLALQTMMRAKNQTPALQEIIQSLIKGPAIGCFVLSEMEHGSNVISLETEAHYDRDTQEFIVNSPTITSLKWMPNTSHRQHEKKAIIFARLFVGDKDEGVFPFLIPLNSDGVEIRLMGDEPGLNLDNSLTRLRNVRIPKDFLLLDEHSEFSAEGEFNSDEPSRRQRLLNAIDELSIARLSAGLATTTAAQGVLFLTVNLATQRKIFAPKSPDVPLAEYSNFYQPILAAIAKTYAMRFYHNHIIDTLPEVPIAERAEYTTRVASLINILTPIVKTTNCQD